MKNTDTLQTKLQRFLVFRSRNRPNHLCVCAARNTKDALKIARQMFVMPRDAFATLETPESFQPNARDQKSPENQPDKQEK